MPYNKKSLTIGVVRPKGTAKDRPSDRVQPQYKDIKDKSNTGHGAHSPLNLDAYERTVRRACCDAYAMLKDFPSRLRFSYYIDRNGRLLFSVKRSAVV